MNFHDEIVKLQERVTAIEKGPVVSPAGSEPVLTNRTALAQVLYEVLETGTQVPESEEPESEPEPVVLDQVQAYAASDGKKFTNLPPMKMHQRGLDAKKKDPLKMPGSAGEAGGEHAEGLGEGNGEDAAAVVAAHGPASEVHITHDHASGSHHVHSTHEDGHATESDHGSADEAHEHGRKLASSGDGDGDELSGLDGAEYE